MIEKTICDYLHRKVNIPAYPEKPEEPCERYILVERTEDSCKDFIYTSTINILVYDQSMYKAAEVDEIIKNAMSEIAELDEICCVRLASGGNNTDEEFKEYRYRAVYEVKYY